MIAIKELLQNQTVDIYDGDADLASGMHDAGASRVTAFDRNGSDASPQSGVAVRSYGALLEAVDCVSNVCALNDRAVKIMLAMYPSWPKHVLLRLRFHPAWLLGLPGLIRRVLIGLVRIEGITKVPNKNGKGNTYWLVIEQSGGAVHSIPVLPKAVGIPAFLKWLADEKMDYLVLRFYESLPELHREAGDLDMLASDEDKEKILAYLKEKEHLATDDDGDIRVGIHNISGAKDTIPYYPPPLARKMLADAVEGPAGSRIPEPRDALNSFIYHCLYHSKKGYSSGIPSTLDDFIDKHPENDYAGVIKAMATELGIEVGETMEEMDEYMASEGWRPKLDTLAKMSWTNAWVRDRFFAPGSEATHVHGLAVFILREWIVKEGKVDEVVSFAESKGFEVIRSKELNETEKQHAFEHLRGGTWGSHDDGSTEGWLPAHAIVVVDTQCAKGRATYSAGRELYRIRELKEAMRAKFDANGMGSMHSTDTTHESWEYIEACFEDEVDVIKEEVSDRTHHSAFFGWISALSPRYLMHSWKQTVRRFVIKRFLE